MTGEQRGLLQSDLISLRQQREDALHRQAEAIQARSRAKELVYQCQAQADSAGLDAELLAVEIDHTLDEINEAS
jgi:hypothetical protein